MGTIAALYARLPFGTEAPSSVPSDASNPFVKVGLLYALLQRAGLPSDVARIVLRYAEEGYPSIHVSRAAVVTVPWHRGSDRLLRLAAKRAPPLFVPHAVEIELDGHDQGWSSFPENHNTLRGSYTWYELSCTNVKGCVEVARNLHAVALWQRHSFTTADPPLLSALDRDRFELCLYARAQYPGWVNSSCEARMSVVFRVA